MPYMHFYVISRQRVCPHHMLTSERSGDDTIFKIHTVPIVTAVEHQVGKAGGVSTAAAATISHACLGESGRLQLYSCCSYDWNGARACGHAQSCSADAIARILRRSKQ